MGGKLIAPATRKKIIELHDSGKKIKEIGIICHVSRWSVARIIKTRGEDNSVDLTGLISFDEICCRVPISKTTLWRIVHTIGKPVYRHGFGGRYYYKPEIIQKIFDSDDYKRAISNRLHKNFMRNHPEAYLISKKTMVCKTCRFLYPQFNDNRQDYTCTNFRKNCEIKNLPNRKSCGCFLWETPDVRTY